ncbi:MAG: HIRAN domain-containing protein [Clostridiaceae bacterium]|nr:HIRAN domain-containing protein [Clostridiaceae bacterium]
MDNYFITITGQNHYLGMKPFKINRLVKIIKESENEHDPEAIRVELPFIDTIGYVANSINTVFAGTCSAGRLYDKIDDYAYAQIMFITHSSAIAIVVSKSEVDEKNTIEASLDETLADPRNLIKPRAKIGF